MITVNYSLQVCDTLFNSYSTRYCSDNKTEVSTKCVTSFLESVVFCAEKVKDCQHNIMIYDDKSSKHIEEFLKIAQEKYKRDNVTILVEKIHAKDYMDSIRTCWNWLRDTEGDLVYQIQDDFLFNQDAIYQMIDIFMQVLNDTGIHSIVTPYHYYHMWTLDNYRYQPTPRMVIPGSRQYWIQCYDITCTFLTSRIEFNKHWDFYDQFLDLDPRSENLENITLNRIVVNRTLGVMPFESVALHMQSEQEKDPYIDWKKRWDSVPKIT